MSDTPSLLIVDADCERLNAMTRFFLQAGFRVTPVSHPRQALEASTFKHFDAAVLSDRLPEISAPSLARRLQAQVSGLKPILVSHLASRWESLEDELALILTRGGFGDQARQVDSLEVKRELVAAAQ